MKLATKLILASLCVSASAQIPVNPPGGGGGGGLPSGTGLVAVHSSVGALGTPVDVFNAAYLSTPQNVSLVDTLPTTPGIQNVFIGSGVAPNNTPGSNGGGQRNVVMGYQAGHAMTTERESVLIGNQAGFNLTGNGTGPDDMIMVLIGSAAGGNLTNLGGASVMIGQKSGVSATNSAQDVFVGTHSCTGCTVTSTSVVIGAGTIDTVNAIQLSNEVIIGQGAGPINAAGSYSNDVLIGVHSGQNEIVGATNNTFIGFQSGSNDTTGNGNTCIGTSCNAGSTGAGNIVFGSGNGGSLTSGGNNVLLGANAAVTTGSYNFISLPLTAGSLGAGSDNFIVGRAAGQNINATHNAMVLLGLAAGLDASADGLVAVGSHACELTTSSGNTCLGNLAGENFTTGSNNTVIGDNAGTALTGAESNDTMIGEGAQVAVGVSSAAEIGPGTNSTANTIAYMGVRLRPLITATTGSIGGSSLAAGACSTGTATIAGGTVGHTVEVSNVGGTLIGGSFKLDAVVTNSTTVTVEICAIVAGTPAATTYNVATY